MSKTNDPQATAKSTCGQEGHHLRRIPPIDTLAKIAAAAIIVCYAIGLLAVNTFLLPYDVSDFNLFRARFIFTGLLLVSIFVLSTACPIVALAFILSAWRTKRGEEGEDSAPFMYDISAMGRLQAVYMAAGFLVIPFSALWLMLDRAWFPSLGGYGINVLLGVILALGFWVARKSRSRVHRTSWSMIAQYGAFASAAVVGIFFVVSYFAGNIYPNTPTEFGGTRGQDVQLLISHDSVQGARNLGVPMQAGTDVTTKVRLLFTGENFYVLQHGSQTFVLTSDIVKGINPEHVP